MDINKYFKGLEGDVNMEIKIKYLEGANELVVNPKGNCIDLYAYEDVFVPYMSYGMINLGFAIQLPEGYIMKIYPRSSTFKTWGIIQTNHCGIVDETYCGDNDIVHMPIQCTMAKVCEKIMVNNKKMTCMGTWIRKGDAICQMEIVKAMDMPTFNKVESLGNSDRGSSSVHGEYDKCGKSK